MELFRGITFTGAKMVLKCVLSFSSDIAYKENTNLFFNASKLHVLCWVDRVFRSKKSCSLPGFTASKGNRVPAKSQLYVEIMLVVKHITTTLFYQNVAQTKITNFITVTK